MNELINKIFLRLTRRSETADRTTLVQTFVEAGALLSLLSSTDHQIVYGRRGTGKTHAFLFLAEQKLKSSDLPVYLDLRNIGSTGGLYSDTSIPLAERGSRLLLDTLAAIHESILDSATKPNSSLNLGQIGGVLDELAEAITEVAVVGQVEQETIQSDGTTSSSDNSVSLSISPKVPQLSISQKYSHAASESSSARIKNSGTIIHRVHFGRLGNVLSKLVGILSGKRIWFLLDEWSAIPIDLQPILADLLRRSILPQRNITLKIAAIEQRSNFKQAGLDNDYLGVELGADISADVNLDDFMVFDNDATRATTFFQDLLFKHFISVLDKDEIPLVPKSSSELVQVAFTQRNAFEEFIRASEGVPRDFINILMIAAQRAASNPFSVPIVRSSALLWFQRDKQAAINSKIEAKELLHWIIEQVIAHRRARAFLLQANVQNKLIDYLFDSRLLHILKRNIAGQDQPGVRFDVYKLDYGCYVDLLNTSHAPEGLLQIDGTKSDVAPQFIEVPPDDYRAIRRAILDLSKFETRNKK